MAKTNTKICGIQNCAEFRAGATIGLLLIVLIASALQETRQSADDTRTLLISDSSTDTMACRLGTKHVPGLRRTAQ